ncbi:MAG: response regulator transcription factor [Gammaproteobacteria bacterium]|nr:response regulator transcription factor [Gammaproteobacteria bacterium]
MKYLIVDDHPIVLNALQTELGAGNECLLANSLGVSMKLIERHRDIDLIILDLDLPDSHGTEALLRLRGAAPTVPILVLSASNDREEIRQVLDLGACGFVPKTTAISVLRHAIQLVLAGGTYWPTEIVRLDRRTTEPARAHGNLGDKLTPRETEILPLIVLGLSNKEIAARLALSGNTVRVHVAHILKKMGVANRTQAAAKLLLPPT